MSVAAIVLAAGCGARFDAARGKLLVEYRGRPLARRAVETALASKASKTIVVTGHARGEIEKALTGLPTTLAYNPNFASGLASSLRVGLALAADDDGALILLADMPDVTSATLDRLIAVFEGAPACAAVMPVLRGRRGNPVLLGRRLYTSVAALTGDEGAGRLLRAVDGVIEIAVDDDGVLMDIDTRQDLKRALGQES